MELNRYVNGKSLEEILHEIFESSKTMSFDPYLTVLASQVRNGDKDAEQRYVSRYMPYIVSVIRLYRDGRYTDIELISLALDELLSTVREPVLPLDDKMTLFIYEMDAIKKRLGQITNQSIITEDRQ